MSLERVIKALIGLGLSRSDAEIYVYLAKKGPNKVVALEVALNYDRKKLHTSLKTLQTRGLVAKEHTTFSALPFEEALDLLIKMEKERAKAVQESREELLST
ncbi:MAG: helix-turn-helix domain-containing protein [Promethearchaeota archaeon]